MDEQTATPASATVDTPQDAPLDAPTTSANAILPSTGELPTDASAGHSQDDGTLTQPIHETTEQLGPDPLARLDDDNSAFVLGMVPLVLMAVLALACVIIYFIKRQKNWHELDEALRIDGGDTPVGSDAHFTTRDLQEMDPTRPSQRVSELPD